MSTAFTFGLDVTVGVLEHDKGTASAVRAFQHARLL